MDLGTIAAAVQRPENWAAARGQRVAVSLRLIGSLLDGRAATGEISPDFAREVRTASRDTLAALIVPPGPGPARVEINGRQYPIPAALRDAIVAALPGPAREGPQAPTTSTPATGATPHETAPTLALPTQALVVAAEGHGAAANAAATHLLASSGVLRATRNRAADEPAQPAPFDVPLFDPHAAAATPERIAARVAGSGAFFESHVAQWARGERSAESLRAEASDLARVAARDPARADARGTLQVETLQRQTITLAGPAWTGQPMQLELGRDPHTVRDEEQGGRDAVEPVFVARLRLDLPHLGTVEVRLRLAGDRIAAHIEGDSTLSVAQLAEALPEFGAALSARGLQPVLLQALRDAVA